MCYYIFCFYRLALREFDFGFLLLLEILFLNLYQKNNNTTNYGRFLYNICV